MTHDRTNDRSDDRDEVVALGNTQDLRSSSVGALRHLDDLDDVKMADGAPDIRGWEVRSSAGDKLGKVSDLLVDTGVMKVRYIEVELDKDVAKDAGRTESAVASSTRRREDDDLTPFRHVLVPIGAARLDDDADAVLLDARGEQLAGIPAYQRGDLTRDYERGLVGSFTKTPADRADSAGSSDDFYSSASFDDRSFFRRRGTPLEGEDYLTSRRASSRPGTQSAGGGPLASDDVQPQLDPRPGSVGDSRI